MNLIEKMNASKEKETVQYTIVELFDMLKEGVAEINQHQLEVHALGEANLNQAMMLAKKTGRNRQPENPTQQHGGLLYPGEEGIGGSA